MDQLTDGHLLMNYFMKILIPAIKKVNFFFLFPQKIRKNVFLTNNLRASINFSLNIYKPLTSFFFFFFEKEKPNKLMCYTNHEKLIQVFI